VAVGPEGPPHDCSAGNTFAPARPGGADSIDCNDAKEAVGVSDTRVEAGARGKSHSNRRPDARDAADARGVGAATEPGVSHSHKRARRPKWSGQAGVRLCRPRSRPMTCLWAALLSLCFSGAVQAVDVNVATLDQLRSIKGIGPKTAELIIEERTRAGRYESIDDLSE